MLTEELTKVSQWYLLCLCISINTSRIHEDDLNPPIQSWSVDYNFSMVPMLRCVKNLVWEQQLMLIHLVYLVYNCTRSSQTSFHCDYTLHWVIMILPHNKVFEQSYGNISSVYMNNYLVFFLRCWLLWSGNYFIFF